MIETSQRLAQADFRGNLQDGVPGTTATGPKKGVLDRSFPSRRGGSAVSSAVGSSSRCGARGSHVEKTAGAVVSSRQGACRGGRLSLLRAFFIRGILPLTAKQPHPQLTPWMPAKGE
ncbi:hypothetical protein J6590_072023 [Homalodisca vitripennis]|nr:hypothetical protein J6590_072023 [Homalodisca vitripennis]